MGGAMPRGELNVFCPRPVLCERDREMISTSQSNVFRNDMRRSMEYSRKRTLKNHEISGCDVPISSLALV